MSLLFLKISVLTLGTFSMYRLCEENKNQYVSLKKWKAALGVDIDPTQVRTQETRFGDTIIKGYQKGWPYYVFEEKKDIVGHPMKFPQTVFRKILNLLDIIVSIHHPGYTLSCYANEKSYYLIYIGRGATRNAEATTLSVKSFLGRILFYKAVVAYLEAMLEKGVIFSLFTIKDVVFVDGRYKNLMITAFHELTNAEEPDLVKENVLTKSTTLQELNELVKERRTQPHSKSGASPLATGEGDRTSRADILCTQNVIMMIKKLEAAARMKPLRMLNENFKEDLRYVDFSDYLNKNLAFDDERTPSLRSLKIKLERLKLSLELTPIKSVRPDPLPAERIRTSSSERLAPIFFRRQYMSFGAGGGQKRLQSNIKKTIELLMAKKDEK